MHSTASTAGFARPLPEVPEAVAADRKHVLDRAVRHLPDAAIDAMRRGLDRSDVRLRPGRLFSDHGDCAVGVMLRELFPAYRRDRGLIGRLSPRYQSVLRAHPQLARALPRLGHIELWFDNTIRVCRELDPSHSVADWSQAVGRWLAGCLYVELERRSRAGAALPWTTAAFGLRSSPWTCASSPAIATSSA
jgi:hypothetical protein